MTTGGMKPFHRRGAAQLVSKKSRIRFDLGGNSLLLFLPPSVGEAMKASTVTERDERTVLPEKTVKSLDQH